MASTLFISLRNLHLPLKKDIMKLSNTIFQQSTRNLYAKSTLGLTSFAEQKEHVHKQLENISDKFKEKMASYIQDNSKGMVFTEDLKNMVYISETDDDFDLVIKMMKKFNSQNKQLRFGNFVFGPVVMRMFHMYNKPDLALECFNSPELGGFFDQLISYQILLDLLYENQRYEEILETFETIQERQLEQTKYPRNVVVVTFAACYKLNNDRSVEYALNLWKNLQEAGHFPMRRATTFCAGLALNQGKPEIALEILSAVRNPNYVTIRNLKVKALSQIGRLDEAIVVLKSIFAEDTPNNVSHTFNRDVIDCVKDAVAKSGDEEVALEFSRLEKILEKEGNIADRTLDEHLCSEIQRPPIMNNRQQNQFSRYQSGPNRSQVNRFTNNYIQRPGLKDLV